MNRAEVENELLGWMREGPWRSDPTRFEKLALALFRIQFAACRPYELFCRSLSRTPETVQHLEDIPAVPTGSFKEFELRCFAKEETRLTFRTSGTSLDRRGALHLDRVDLYEASLIGSLRQTLLVGWKTQSACMRILAPDAEESPESSLSYMFERLINEEGGPASGFDLIQGALDVEGLRKAVREARERDQPMLIAGTAFAFVHFLDGLADAGESEWVEWALPTGSRLMETGGFKGRSREIPREELRRNLATCFSIPETDVINQYGMTELGSQFYDSTILDPEGPRRKLSPPWARVRIVDPISGEDVTPGEVGLILIHDLANSGSVAALLTADLGRAIRNEAGETIGFDVLGRAQGAEARGCSIAADAMLEAARDFQR